MSKQSITFLALLGNVDRRIKSFSFPIPFRVKSQKTETFARLYSTLISSTFPNAHQELINHGIGSGDIPVTIHSLLDPSEKPSSEELEKCLKGISIRNSYMHLIKKKGGYRISSYSDDEIYDAFHGVDKVYNCFRIAFESRLKSLIND